MKSIKQLKQKLASSSFKRSKCSVSCVLDVIGDKWTLLVIRDLLRGRTRYKEFLESGEGITTNILANRLQNLEQSGLIAKKPYQDNPIRYNYELTSVGKDLKTVIFEMIDWAEKYIPASTIKE